MSTVYYGYPNFVYSETIMNQLLDTFAEMVDEDMYTLSGTLSGNYYEKAEVEALDATLSGVLHAEIEALDYYTEAEVDALDATLSGVLSAEIDTDIATHAAADSHTIYPMVDGSRSFTDGLDAWLDDGVNFRATFSGGILTGLSATVSGGYQII